LNFLAKSGLNICLILIFHIAKPSIFPLVYRRSASPSLNRVSTSACSNACSAFASFYWGPNVPESPKPSNCLPTPARSLIKAVARDGLPAFEDRRRRSSSFLPAAAAEVRSGSEPPRALSVRSDRQGIHVDFGADAANALLLPPSRPLQTKVVLLSLLETGLIDVGEVGDLLGYGPAHVRNLAAKLAAEDVSALLDHRQGQQQDYRVDEIAKRQIIKQFVLAMVQEGKASARVLAERLDRECQLSIPQRTVGHYMQKFGLTEVKQSLRRSLQAIKKTPEPGTGGGAKAGGGQAI